MPPTTGQHLSHTSTHTKRPYPQSFHQDTVETAFWCRKPFNIFRKDFLRCCKIPGQTPLVNPICASHYMARKSYEKSSSAGLEGPITPTCFQTTPRHDESPVDSSMVRFWMRIYATRNETFHCGVREAVDKRNWAALQTYLLTHEKLLPSLLPETHDRDDTLVLKTIAHLRKRYFRTLNGEMPLHLTKLSLDLDRRQQQRSASSTAPSTDNAES